MKENVSCNVVDVWGSQPRISMKKFFTAAVFTLVFVAYALAQNLGSHSVVSYVAPAAHASTQTFAVRSVS